MQFRIFSMNQYHVTQINQIKLMTYLYIILFQDYQKIIIKL
ncbi:hypothetical protein pb186bvf_002534 [Paramecium bursaria]